MKSAWDQKKIAIVGVGALGSHVALFCRNIDATFIIIDFDRIEKKNTMSQFHTVMGVGKAKAIALRQSMQGLFKKALLSYNVKLADSNIDTILGGYDLVVDCTDNIEARELLKEYCGTRVPLLHGALAADGEFGACVWTEHFKPDAQPGEGAATCEDGEQLPFIAFVSSVISMAIQEFVNDNKKRSSYIYPAGLKTVA
jgi:hypothetical protein